MDTPLVTVIMAAYNAEPYVAEAVRSALAQTHRNIELIIVNDGSTDRTAAVLRSFNDPRIRLIEQANAGISRARNAALDHVHGAFVCFLDADDVMPPRSIEARLAVLTADPGLTFADGTVIYYDRALSKVLRSRVPSFNGEPLSRLAVFDRSCFFGNTWLIRWDPRWTYRFKEGITHAEDLLFYMTMAQGRRYGHTREPVLHYRITGHSSMSRLDELERSYHFVHEHMRQRPELFDRATLRRNRFLIRRMMSGAYWHARRPFQALLAWFR